MTRFVPNLGVLPTSQREVWSQLGATPEHFVLYGGTALALRLGHRKSVDFDFFSSRPFQSDDLVRSVPYLRDQVVTLEEKNTLGCDIACDSGVVKISFFGGLTIRQIATPDVVASNGVAIASPQDLLGTKCATIPRRNEVKDYLDIHALLTQCKFRLAEGIAAASAIYGRQFNPVLTLQALTYFDDLPEPLPDAIKSDLHDAVKAVSLQNLPKITANQKIGDGVSRPRL